MSENINDKYKAIVEWLKDYVPLSKYVYFNVILDQPDTASVNSVSSARYLREFINGNKEVELVFAISLQEDYDSGGTSENVNFDGILEYTKLSEWIETQNKNSNFPTFADNEHIERIEVMQNLPTLTTDQAGEVAKYLGQFKITYLEEKK